MNISPGSPVLSALVFIVFLIQFYLIYSRIIVWFSLIKLENILIKIIYFIVFTLYNTFFDYYLYIFIID